MKELDKYDIDIMGLSDRQHVFEFESGESFFEEMEQEVLLGGHFKTELLLEKSSTMIQLGFTIDGIARLACDRSLEEFEEPIHTGGKLILKFGDENLELTDEIALIHRNTNRINVARYIFEFIALAIPMKRIHPDLREEDDEDEWDEEEEEGKLVYVAADEEDEDEQTEDEEIVDPRWAALKALNKK